MGGQLKPYKAPSKAAQTARRVTRRITRPISNEVHNRISKPAKRRPEPAVQADWQRHVGSETAGKFGRPGTPLRMNRMTARVNTVGPAYAGGMAAGIVGSHAYDNTGSRGRRNVAIAANKKKITANNKQLKQQKVSKGRATLITDLGTPVKRAIKSDAKHPSWSPKTAVVTAGGIGGVFGAGAHHVTQNKKKVLANQQKRLAVQQSALNKRGMSDTEIRHRKKIQGQIGRTTSTLGLTGLGLTGAAAVAARKPGVLRQLKKAPKLGQLTSEKMKNTAINTGIISGGIGGVGGFNQAAVYSAESKRRRTPVSKGVAMEMGYYGEQGQALSTEQIEKAWSPVASTFDSEKSRKRRAKSYEAGAGVAAGASAAYGVHHGSGTLQAIKRAAPKEVATVHRATDSAGRLARRASPSQSYKALPLSELADVAHHGKRAAIGAAATGAAAASGVAINRKRKKSWQTG